MVAEFSLFALTMRWLMSIGCTGAMAIKEPGSDDESRRSEDDGGADEDSGDSANEDEGPSDEDDDQQSVAE